MPQLKRRSKNRGSAYVEAAFIFLALFTMLIGAFDFGQFLFVHQAIIERARYAARWGAIYGPTNTTAIQNMVLYYQYNTPAAGTPAYMGLAPANIEVSTAGAGTDNHRLTVRITNYRFSTIAPYLAGSYIARNVDVVVPLGLAN